MSVATAIAHPNIALCKYWGKRDRALNLPSVPSLSLTVAPFFTRTTVEWGRDQDLVQLNGQAADASTQKKVLRVLDLLDPWRPRVHVTSENSFPTAAGLASSSSGFAALVVAAAAASGQRRSLTELSCLARQGSGSAARSLFGGWVEWPLGSRMDGADSHGVPVAGPEHWDLRMVVAVVASGRKETLSTDGMTHCELTSPYYTAWVASAPADVDGGRAALLRRDLTALGTIMERSTLRMHACMMSSDPPILYWKAGTLAAYEVVRQLRKDGVPCYATMDAGPNVKVLCRAADVELLRLALLRVVDRVELLHPAAGARLVPNP